MRAQRLRVPDMSEKDWISTYFAPIATAEGADGLRDDVARLSSNAQTIITVDAVVEGVHFLATDPLDTVAQKLVRVNVSDCLASGAWPVEAVLTLGWPSGRTERELSTFAAALGRELSAWGISLLGGDTVTHSGALFVSLTMTGVCHGEGPVRRSGALVEDDVWLSGVIGAAKLGYDAIQAGEASEFDAVYRVPNLPKPDIALLIAQHATASLDVSDGLLSDSKCLANASKTQLDIDLDAVLFANNPKSTKEKLALATWGDDYQCLFTAPVTSRVPIENWANSSGQLLSRIGSVRIGEGISISSCGICINLPETLGFEHD